MNIRLMVLCLFALSLLPVSAAPVEDGFYVVVREVSEPQRVGELKPSQTLLLYDPRFLGEEGPQRQVIVENDTYAPIHLKEPPTRRQDTTERTKFWLGVSLSGEAATKLETLSRENLGGTVAVVVGGRVVTMHGIKGVLRGGKVQISRCGDDGCQVLMNELRDNIAEPKALPISFPDGYSGSREGVLVAVARAQGRVDMFASQYGWAELARPLPYDSVEIYQTAEALQDRVKAMYDLPPETRLPGPPVAGLEKRVLLAVSKESFARLRPTQVEFNHFEILLAHEIGHRLHVAILEGDEDAMGPRWFYEGFAVVASGQMNRGVAAPEKAREYMDSNDYESYGKLLRLCLKRWDLPTLVAKASQDNFEEWILAGLAEAGR